MKWLKRFALLTSTALLPISYVNAADSQDNEEESSRIEKQFKNVKEELATEVESAAESASETWSDSTEAFKEGVIVGQLNIAYLLNDHLSAFNISPNVDGDMVRLEGEVESEVYRQLAGEIAKGIEGVNQVVNQLVVNRQTKKQIDEDDENFSQHIEDISTTAAIKAQLVTNDIIDGTTVDIDTENSIVTLEGEVDSEALRSLVETMVRNRDDVDRVINNLNISS